MFAWRLADLIKMTLTGNEGGGAKHAQYQTVRPDTIDNTLHVLDRRIIVRETLW